MGGFCFSDVRVFTSAFFVKKDMLERMACVLNFLLDPWPVWLPPLCTGSGI